MRLATIAFVTILVSLGCRAQDLSDAELQVLFRNMLSSRGPEYEQLRNQLVASKEHAAEFLQRKIGAPDVAGRDRILGEILMARLSLTDTDKTQLFAPMKFHLGKADSAINAASAEIAVRFAKHSTLILEAYLKGNEIKDVQHEKYVSSVLANDDSRRLILTKVLGELREKRALWPLIESLKEDHASVIAQETAVALGHIGSPSALEPLLQILEVTGPPVEGEILKVLPKFVDTGSLPILEKFAAGTQSKSHLQEYNSIISVLRTKARLEAIKAHGALKEQPGFSPQEESAPVASKLWDKYIRGQPRYLGVSWDIIPDIWVLRSGKIDARTAACLCVFVNQWRGMPSPEYPLTVADFLRYAKDVKLGQDLTGLEQQKVSRLYDQARAEYMVFAVKDHEKCAAALTEMMSGEKLKVGWIRFLKQLGLESTVGVGTNPRFDEIKQAVHRNIPVIITENNQWGIVIGYIAERAPDGRELDFIIGVRPDKIETQALKEETLPQWLSGFGGSQISNADAFPAGAFIEPFCRERYTWHFFYNIRRGAASWEEEICAIVDQEGREKRK